MLISMGNPWSFLMIMVTDPSGSVKVLDEGFRVAAPELATTSLVQSEVWATSFGLTPTVGENPQMIVKLCIINIFEGVLLYLLFSTKVFKSTLKNKLFNITPRIHHSLISGDNFRSVRILVWLNYLIVYITK